MLLAGGGAAVRGFKKASSRETTAGSAKSQSATQPVAVKSSIGWSVSPMTAPPQMHWQHFFGACSGRAGWSDGPSCECDAKSTWQQQHAAWTEGSPPRFANAPDLHTYGQAKIAVDNKMESTRLSIKLAQFLVPTLCVGTSKQSVPTTLNLWPHSTIDHSPRQSLHFGRPAARFGRRTTRFRLQAARQQLAFDQRGRLPKFRQGLDIRQIHPNVCPLAGQ